MFNRTAWQPIAIASALLFAVLTAPAAAQSGGSYGYVRALDGSAILDQAGDDGEAAVEMNQPILAGDRLRVPEGSRLEVVLADGNLLRIDGGTEIEFARLANSPDADDEATVLKLLFGNVQLVYVEDAAGDAPRVETDNAIVYLEDYGEYRIAADRRDWTQVVVREGYAEVSTGEGSQVVREDEEAQVDGEEVEVRQAGGSDPLERWAYRLRQDYDTASVPYVDEGLRYQAAPLARHGRWYTAEGRHVWRPYVSVGWSPYTHGRWRYTPSGLAWVSYEPWGWVPYHYGTWDYVPAYGWVWVPGSVFAPAWVYWYWGPSYVGWCPTGYYTRFYGSRFHDPSFRFGVYGWAGGDWGLFSDWTFVPTRYFGHRDWGRYAHRGRELRGREALPRGIITTDTRPIKPGDWTNPRGVIEVFDRRGGGRKLPDVTPFIARKAELPGDVKSVVVAGPGDRGLEGTPLRPGSLGRGGDRGSRVARGPAAPGQSPGRGAPGRREDGDQGRVRIDRDGRGPGGRDAREARGAEAEDSGRKEGGTWRSGPGREAPERGDDRFDRGSRGPGGREAREADDSERKGAGIWRSGPGREAPERGDDRESRRPAARDDDERRAPAVDRGSGPGGDEVRGRSRDDRDARERAGSGGSGGSEVRERGDSGGGRSSGPGGGEGRGREDSKERGRPPGEQRRFVWRETPGAETRLPAAAAPRFPWRETPVDARATAPGRSERERERYVPPYGTRRGDPGAGSAAGRYAGPGAYGRPGAEVRRETPPAYGRPGSASPRSGEAPRSYGTSRPSPGGERAAPPSRSARPAEGKSDGGRSSAPASRERGGGPGGNRGSGGRERSRGPGGG